MNRLALALLPAVFAACSNSNSPNPVPVEPPGAGAVSRVDLRSALGLATIEPVGVTVMPDTGELYLLDAEAGVYRLEAGPNGQSFFRRVFTADELEIQVDPDSPFTDLAAMGDGTFAITARNDGFLLDLADGSIQQHFCYVPSIIIGPNPGVGVEQLTTSCAFDVVNQRILAQPQTFFDGALIQSELGTFPITGGDGTDWHPMPSRTFIAGGMTVDESAVIWLGQADELYQYDLSTDELMFVRSLDEFGIQWVRGLCFRGDHLIVLDGVAGEMVWIPLARL
ncbi:MAG: hypothetical protein AAF196_20280 [Planctomycetota bacterium]